MAPSTKFEAALATAREQEQEITRNLLADLTGMAHVGHNSGVSEWYTPVEILNGARLVMGEIDLDPASNSEAQAVIHAKIFYTAEDDGLTKEWRGRVWMNPPYSQPLIGQLVGKLVSSPVDQAMVLVNNATETEWGQSLLRWSDAVCFPKGRIKFCRCQPN